MSSLISPTSAPGKSLEPTSKDETTPVVEPNLQPLIQEYVSEDTLPSTEWLTRLNLQTPRIDTRCLGERTRLIKRLTDIVVASILLVLLSPLMLLVAILVKLTSPGPIIYRQVRVGLNLRRWNDRRKGDRFRPRRERRHSSNRRVQFSYGKPFVLYKFRTMRIDAEVHGARFAQENDPRVTWLGRLLRKTRCDELPQLWNVLRGEMTLVGPRPERPEFMQKLSQEIPNYLDRLGLKPGLTGLAQILNGYDNHTASFRRRVALDLLYLQNCCFWNDVKILVRTIAVVLTGSGAL